MLLLCYSSFYDISTWQTDHMFWYRGVKMKKRVAEKDLSIVKSFQLTRLSLLVERLWGLDRIHGICYLYWCAEWAHWSLFMAERHQTNAALYRPARTTMTLFCQKSCNYQAKAKDFSTSPSRLVERSLGQGHYNLMKSSSCFDVCFLWPSKKIELLTICLLVLLS